MRITAAPLSAPSRGVWRALALILLSALLIVGGCAPQRQATGPFPRFAEYDERDVRRVSFSGDIRIPEDSLRAIILTKASRCRFLFLPFCLPFTSLGREEYRLDLDELARDVARIQLYHRDHGYYGARVEPYIEPLDEERVAVDFVIAPGRQVILRSLAIQGVDSILPDGELLATIPLRLDEPFGRVDFLASADTIRRQLLQRGHAYADVLRNYGIDTIAGVAEAEFVAIPGPLVYVDSIIFQGNERLSERTLRRQLPFREGDVLRNDLLAASQRNLYSLEMVNVAAVRLAPDSLQLDPTPEQATVLVQVGEAAQYAVEASLGFGTVDCIRGGGRWINRNFIGGGRRLEVVGSVSRVGVGHPTNLGLEESVCRALGEEELIQLTDLEVVDRLDYSLQVGVQQPTIFGTLNQLGVNLHTERVSEIEAYIRESSGAQVSATRQLRAGGTVLTTAAEVERGRTIASPAILCVGFDTCGEDDFDVLSNFRWSNVLSLAAVQDAQITDGINSRGYVLRGSADWSSALLGSEDNYLRLLTEGSYYHPLQPGWVLAGNLRVGRFISGSLGEQNSYIPPERRFYAGGPASVRGYTRNALGPTVYVNNPDEGGIDNIVSSATGGTQMIVGSVELRMPSPWLSDIARLAAFVDAGHVAAPGTELLSATGLRVTPGAGLRLLTPVGPFRLDVAYNPYRPIEGPLYLLDQRGLLLVDRYYNPDPPSFLQQFRVQFALGQAF